MLQSMENQSSSKTSEKKFIFDQIQFTFHSIESIRKREYMKCESQQLVNHPSEVHLGRITKLFQINFPYHSIKIEDTLTLELFGNAVRFNQQEQIQQSKCEKQVSKSSNKKTVLFKNSAKVVGLRDKGSKKNVVKNIVNAFLSYVKQLKAEGMKIEKIIQLLQALILKTKFNNQLVNDIIKNNQLRNYFREFLSQSAPSWVQNSKLKSKGIHQDAIALYEQFCNQKNEEMFRKNEDQMEEVQNDQNQYYFQSGINHELQEQIRHFK